MQQGTAAKAPLSYWVVAILSLLWNAMGGIDYTMTRLRNADYLKSAGDPQVILAWVDSFPVWAQVGWALGVWGSVAGSLLLLARSRHAVNAFLVSLLGALVSFGYQFTHALPPAMESTSGKAMPVLIILVVLFLWQFSRKEAGKGMLR